MTPDLLRVGERFPGSMPDTDSSVFEFPKYGPELRLFFADVPDDLVRCVEREDVHIGVLRHGDLGIVPWKIGDQLQGDAQFHIFLYLPEMRPIDEILSSQHRYVVQITLVDRSSGKVRALRRVLLSNELSIQFNEIVAYQLGNHIGREDYDAQVSVYQNQFPDLETVVAAAAKFEKAEDLQPA
jgi:hypothetical protein